MRGDEELLERAAATSALDEKLLARAAAALDDAFARVREDYDKGDEGDEGDEGDPWTRYAHRVLALHRGWRYRRRRSEAWAHVVARARRWRERRDALRMSTAAVAAALGVSAQRASNLLCAKTAPSKAEVERLNTILGELV